MLGSLGTASGAVAVAPEKMLPLFGNFFFDREPRQQAPRAMPHAAPFPAALPEAGAAEDDEPWLCSAIAL